MATPVSGVYGYGDEKKKRSVCDFTHGETVVARTAGDKSYATTTTTTTAAKKAGPPVFKSPGFGALQRPTSARRTAIDALAAPSPRKSRAVITLQPTSRGGDPGGGEKKSMKRWPVLTCVIPSCCESLADAYERVSDVILLSGRASTRVQKLYDAAGKPIESLEQLADGELILYRCAAQVDPGSTRARDHEPRLRTRERERRRAASLAEPRAGAGGGAAAAAGAGFFEVTVDRVASAGGGAGAAASSASSTAPIALRVPDAVHGWSLRTLKKKMARAAKLASDEEIVAIWIEDVGGQELEFASQLVRDQRLVYACEGDALPPGIEIKSAATAREKNGGGGGGGSEKYMTPAEIAEKRIERTKPSAASRPSSSRRLGYEPPPPLPEDLRELGWTDRVPYQPRPRRPLSAPPASYKKKRAEAARRAAAGVAASTAGTGDSGDGGGDGGAWAGVTDGAREDADDEAEALAASVAASVRADAAAAADAYLNLDDGR